MYRAIGLKDCGQSKLDDPLQIASMPRGSEIELMGLPAGGRGFWRRGSDPSHRAETVSQAES